MTPLTVAQVSARLLAYSTYAAGDSAQFPAGTNEALYDAIYGAILDMKDAAPGLFRKKIGGYLGPKTATTALLAAGGTSVTLGAGTWTNLRTMRIANGKCDYTLSGISGPTGVISPAWEGAAGTFAADIWHDAWNYGSGTTLQEGEVDIVRVNGRVLERSGSRQQAEQLWGVDGLPSGNTSMKRASTNTDLPRIFWIERHLGVPHVMVYPMADAAVNIEAEVVHGHHNALAVADILTSAATFDLPADLSVNVWRPLAVGRFRAFPLMTRVSLGDEMERQIKKAEKWLRDIRPKKTGMRGWNEPRVAEPPLALNP